MAGDQCSPRRLDSSSPKSATPTQHHATRMLPLPLPSRKLAPYLESRQRRTKAQVLDEGIEVPVAVKKRQAALDAARGDHRVDRLAHGDPERSQHSKVPGGLNRNFLPRQVHDQQRRQQLPGLVEVAVSDEALQHLGQDQVAGRKRLAAEQRVQLLRLRRRSSAEVVDPDAGIDQDHRSALIASRSPCQSSLPRKRRICSCCPNRSKVRSPSSTASRLVFSPVARSVSLISLSSMTILVRMVCILSRFLTHSRLIQARRQ